MSCLYKNQQWLYKTYVEDKTKVEDIAKECNVTTDTIYKWLDKYKIPRRTHKAIEVVCLNCGKTFKKMQCEINKGNKNHYCSQQCCIEYRRKNLKVNPNYKEENSFKCDYCGKEIRVDKSKQMRNKHNFCSKECFGKWEATNRVGENSSNYKNALLYKTCIICNKEFTTYFKNQKCCSIECGNKIKENKKTLVCVNCNKEFTRTASQIFWSNKRGYENIFCSTKCKKEYHKGENHPNYIQDRTQLKDTNKSIRWSKEMCDWRKAVYERDNYTCQMCGNKSSKGNAVILNAHHIERFVDNEYLRFDVNNGITLCEECHKLTYGKEKEFEKQFKEIIENKKKQQISQRRIEC